MAGRSTNATLLRDARTIFEFGALRPRCARRVPFIPKNPDALPPTALNRLATTVRCSPLPASRGESPRPSDFSHWLRNQKSLVCFFGKKNANRFIKISAEQP
jgi:hypothetical protein